MVTIHDQTETLNIKIYDQMKPKTIREWLNTIEDETIRSQAIENISICGTTHVERVRDLSDMPLDCLKNIILTSFWWDRAPQGNDYWAAIYEKAANGTLKTREI